MAKDKKVLACCGACGGSGVYCGFAEPEGEGVVCMECEGSGGVEISYTPFSKRVLKKGVQFVSTASGRFIFAEVGPKEGTKMTYEEFLEKVPAATPEREREL